MPFTLAHPLPPGVWGRTSSHPTREQVVQVAWRSTHLGGGFFDPLSLYARPLAPTQPVPPAGGLVSLLG